jgi:23S rRNA (uridine2552-2'-O)-methyltransferase
MSVSKKSGKPGQNRWSDHYTRRARKESYPARSVYKLQEIQRRFNVIRTGDRVLDLGCAPGSWLKYAAGLAGSGGKVTGIDRKPVTIAMPGNVSVAVADVLALDDDLPAAIGSGYQVVLSDMAPDTTGAKDTDAARSYHLSRAALSLAERVLLPGGRFVCKIFQGPDFQNFQNAVKQHFSTTKLFKPQSSRKASREMYVIGLGKV